MNPVRNEKDCARASMKIKKLLSSADVQSVETSGSRVVVEFKNGQIFGMSGRAVVAAMHSPSLPETKEKNYTVPKRGQGIGQVLVYEGGEPAHWKPVFVRAEFEMYGIHFAVRHVRNYWQCYEVQTGTGIFSTAVSGGSMQACVDAARKILTEHGEKKVQKVVADALQMINSFGKLPVLAIEID